MTAPLLAHAGGLGWDEALFVLLPVVVLLVLARQARKNLDEAGDDIEAAGRPPSSEPVTGQPAAESAEPPSSDR